MLNLNAVALHFECNIARRTEEQKRGDRKVGSVPSADRREMNWLQTHKIFPETLNYIFNLSSMLMGDSESHPSLPVCHAMGPPHQKKFSSGSVGKNILEPKTSYVENCRGHQESCQTDTQVFINVICILKVGAEFNTTNKQSFPTNLFKS